MAASEEEGKRTVLITNGNLLSMLSLGEFLLEYGSAIQLVLVTTKLPSSRSNLDGIYSMLIRSGARYTGFKLMTNVFLPRWLALKGYAASVPDLLERAGFDCPVLRVSNVNDEAVVEEVERICPDILLSFSAASRFDTRLLRARRRCSINAHYALLPEYAGLSPYFWYLRNQERESGVTLHEMVPTLDAGPVIEQCRFSTGGVRTVAGVLTRQMELVSPMLLRFYRGETGLEAALPQDLTRRSYFRHPTHQDVIALSRSGCGFASQADWYYIAEWARELALMAEVRGESPASVR